MKNLPINTIFKVRAVIFRSLKPKGRYLLPASRKFGFDRGTPIDRFWIESFLEKNKKFIQGRVLEITDNKYTLIYGKGRVKKSDVLDIDEKNKKANIIGDLRDLKNIKSNTYDCIILTHVLGQIDDFNSAVRELARITKKGGVVLVTSSCISPTADKYTNYWRFTPHGLSFIFKKYFRKVEEKSFGNALTGQAFWIGLAQEELTKNELEFNDPGYACVAAVIAKK